MRRVAEIMHIAPELRDQFIEDVLHPDEQTLKVMWKCGVRNQQYFGLNNLLFMTFEYVGNHFKEDMAEMAQYLEASGHLITKRRRDVPLSQRDTASWWAPVKKIGQLLDETPAFAKGDAEMSWENDYHSLVGGGMITHNLVDTTYDEEDWVDDFHF